MELRLLPLTLDVHINLIYRSIRLLEKEVCLETQSQHIQILLKDQKRLVCSIDWGNMHNQLSLNLRFIK